VEYIYTFDSGFSKKNELGNKGANLALMTQLGLRVPPGFIVSISAYHKWREEGIFPSQQIREAIHALEAKTGKKLGKGLEVSVRSSAPVSMPGMMDTILNVGSIEQVEESVKTIFKSWDNPRANEYRRLNNIAANLGTAAVVQTMVYGNKDDLSATGVVFSRNPSTGAKGLFGEYLTPPRVKSSFRESVLRNRYPISKICCRQRMPSLQPWPTDWNGISAICRISNSQSNPALYISCKHAMVREPAMPQSRLPWTWSMKV
jgi:phosphoenolpyruvate synthase/pyruvate phosphate dikinase